MSLRGCARCSKRIIPPKRQACGPVVFGSTPVSPKNSGRLATCSSVQEVSRTIICRARTHIAGRATTRVHCAPGCLRTKVWTPVFRQKFLAGQQASLQIPYGSGNFVETSSHQTTPTAIQSAGAETSRPHSGAAGKSPRFRGVLVVRPSRIRTGDCGFPATKRHHSHLSLLPSWAIRIRSRIAPMKGVGA